MAGGNPNDPNDPNRGSYPQPGENEPHPDDGSQQGGGPQPSGYPPAGSYPQQGAPEGYPQHAYQPYGSPNQQAYQPQMKPDRGAMLLVFSILSWVFCVIFGIIAFFMARTDLEEIRAGQMDPRGEGLTKAAYWISIISMIFVACIIVLYIFIFAALGASGSFS